MQSGVLTGGDRSGAAQVAAAHCPNEQTLDPAVCSQTPMPQRAALWPSPRNVLWQRLTIFSSEYYQTLIATHLHTLEGWKAELDWASKHRTPNCKTSRTWCWTRPTKQIPKEEQIVYRTYYIMEKSSWNDNQPMACSGLRRMNVSQTSTNAFVCSTVGVSLRLHKTLKKTAKKYYSQWTSKSINKCAI